MESEKILDRIKNVYRESLKLSYTETEKEHQIYNPENKYTEESKSTDINSQSLHKSLHDSYVTEIEGNYLLFFNEIYTSTFRKWLKNILKKIAWPILKRQIYFNSSIKKILYDVMQINYEYSIKHREIDNKLSQLDQRTEILPQLEQRIGILPQLEQRIEILPQLEQRIEKLSQLEQRIKILPQLEQKIEKLSQLEQRIGKLSQLEQKIEKLSQLEQRIEQIATEIHVVKDVNSQFASAEEAKKSSGLWFNDPIWIGHRDDGEAYWVETTERILEKTFVIHSLANLYDSKQIEILDVGAAESLLSYELASFNYSVTAIDIRPIALFHPNLKFVKTDICKPVLPPASFDCVIALSTLEHIGLGWYGDKTGENYDIEAVKQIYFLLKPEGYFLLTVPYGKKAVTPVHRIYDQESLQRLIQNFDVTQISYGVRKDEFTWTITEDELEASAQEHNPNNYLPGAVAMLVCKKLIL